ncbi:hypothetical protein D3C71_277740 [compost metagenome]
MRKLITKIRDIPYALAAASTVAALGVAGEANAANNVGTVAKSVFDQTTNVGKLVLAGFALGGIFMFGLGFFKLKEASENPQTKYSAGAWRIAVGAGLVAIPTVAAIMTNTFSLGDPGSMSVQGGASF